MSQKKTNQTEIYSRITNQIIADLEKGVKSWTKPWSGSICLASINLSG